MIHNSYIWIFKRWVKIDNDRLKNWRKKNVPPRAILHDPGESGNVSSWIETPGDQRLTAEPEAEKREPTNGIQSNRSPSAGRS